MSVYCRVTHVDLFMKALGVLGMHPDAYVDLAFTEDEGVVLHVGAEDRNTTATAVLPRAVFGEYSASGDERDGTLPRFSVHLPSLADALLLLGPHALADPATRVVLAYPTADARLLVELTHAGGAARALQSKLTTRAITAAPLDLRFRDGYVTAEATVAGDAAREVVADLGAAQCTQAALRLSPRDGLVIGGHGGPYGDVRVTLRHSCEPLINLACDKNETAETRVSVHHLALGCGARLSGGAAAATRAGGGLAGMMLGDRGGGAGGGGGGSGAAGGFSLFRGFERLTVSLNNQRQLSITHMQRDNDVKVTVIVVVMPLRNYDDL